MMGYLNGALNFYFRREERHSLSLSRPLARERTNRRTLSRTLSWAPSQHRAGFIKAVIFYEKRPSSARFLSLALFFSLSLSVLRQQRPRSAARFCVTPR